MNAIKQQISELHKEIESCEAERESRGASQQTIAKYNSYIKMHNLHLSNLERELRRLDNGLTDPYTLEPILSRTKDYLQNYRSKDFAGNESTNGDLAADVLSSESSTRETPAHAETTTKQQSILFPSLSSPMLPLKESRIFCPSVLECRARSSEAHYKLHQSYIANAEQACTSWAFEVDQFNSAKKFTVRWFAEAANSGESEEQSSRTPIQAYV